MGEKAGQTVGGSIQSLCTRCKAATRHVIIAVVAGRAAKVQCTTCQGFHNYRDPQAAPPAVPPQGRKGSPSLRTLEEEWLAQMKGRDPKQAIPYGQSARPQPGDLVEHPSFGFGLTLKVLPPNKIELLFRDGVRLLRWAF